MQGLTRRGIIRAAALGTVAGTVASAIGSEAAAIASPVAPAAAASTGAASTVVVPAPHIVPADRRYGDFAIGANNRFVGTPDFVIAVTSPDQVVAAVRDAVSHGQRLAVRSGGHCYENFVANDDVRVVIDLSQMNAISYDAGRRAFAVEAGATLEQTYKALFRGWGVTIPGGSCPSVGIGGHIAGGGYGPLSRLHGLTVDHLYAVEVVTVDASGGVRAVVATREPTDPHRDLWWAHTGGGGGNFGVVTRYWFRSPDATSANPAQLLPAPPIELLVADLMFLWPTMTQAGFVTLLRNFGAWQEANSAPDSPYAGLFSQLKPQHQAAGTFNLSVQIDATTPDADTLMTDYLTAMLAGTGLAPIPLERRRLRVAALDRVGRLHRPP